MRRSSAQSRDVLIKRFVRIRHARFGLKHSNWALMWFSEEVPRGNELIVQEQARVCWVSHTKPFLFPITFSALERWCRASIRFPARIHMIYANFAQHCVLADWTDVLISTNFFTNVSLLHYKTLLSARSEILSIWDADNDDSAKPKKFLRASWGQLLLFTKHSLHFVRLIFMEEMC